MPDILNHIDNRSTSNSPALTDQIRPKEKAGTSNSDYRQRLSDSINRRTESKRSAEPEQRSTESRRSVETENRQAETSVDSRQSTKDVSTTQQERTTQRSEKDTAGTKRAEQNSVNQRDDIDSKQIEVEQVNEENVEEVSQQLVVDAEVVQQKIEPPASIVQLFSKSETDESGKQNEISTQEADFDNGPALPPAGLIDAVAVLDNKGATENAVENEVVDVEVQENAPEVDATELLNVDDGEKQAETELIQEAALQAEEATRRDDQAIQQKRDETGKQPELQKTNEPVRREVDQNVQINSQNVEETDNDSASQESASDENNIQRIPGAAVSNEKKASQATETPTFTPQKVSLQDHRTQKVDKSESNGEQSVDASEANSNGGETGQTQVSGTVTTSFSESQVIGEKAGSTETAPGKVSVDNVSSSLESGQRTTSAENTKATTKAVKVSVDAGEIVERAAQAIRNASTGDKQMRVRLSPPELGVMNVKVTTEAGVISATLEVETPAAQKALLENMAMLRESLSHVGGGVDRIEVQLSDRSLDDQTPDSQYAEDQNQEQQQDQSDRNEKESNDDQSSSEADHTVESIPLNESGRSQARSEANSAPSVSNVIDELDIAI